MQTPLETKGVVAERFLEIYRNLVINTEEVVPLVSSNDEILPLLVTSIVENKTESERVNANNLVVFREEKKENLRSKPVEEDTVLTSIVDFYFNFFKNKLTINNEFHMDIDIKNIHGLIYKKLNIQKFNTFTRCGIVKKNEFLYKVTCVIQTNIDGLFDSNVFQPIFYMNSNLKKCLTEIFKQLNNYIYCKSCGKIKHVDLYHFVKDEEEQRARKDDETKSEKDKKNDEEEVSKCIMCKTSDWLHSANKPESCTICLKDVKNYYTLRCGHKFHRECVSDIQGCPKRCPNCRKIIDEEQEEMYNHYENDDDDEQSEGDDEQSEGEECSDLDCCIHEDDKERRVDAREEDQSDGECEREHSDIRSTQI